jgi:hypothetical protein
MKRTKKTTKPGVQIKGTPVTNLKTPKGWKKIDRPASQFFKFTEYGQELVGLFKGIIKAKKKNYADNLEVETATGTVLVSLSYDLKQVFANIDKGTQVKIVFVDSIPLKNGKHLKKFEVFTR